MIHLADFGQWFVLLVVMGYLVVVAAIGGE